MSWFVNLFSSGAAKVIDSLGTAIDKLVTSDEEREKLKVALEKEMNTFKETQLEALANYDREIAQRRANDMKSEAIEQLIVEIDPQINKPKINHKFINYRNCISI